MAIPNKNTGDQLSAVEVNEIVDRLPYAFVFDNVADMQASTSLANDDFVMWRGYYNPGDGGGNTGQFKTTWSMPHDGGTVFGIGILGKVVADIHNREVNFFQFGAIDNGTNTIFTNDSTLAIQRCFDSDFHVRGSAGYFYITDSLHLQRSKHYEFLGTGAPDYTTSYQATPPDHTNIYTNLNIDMCRVETQDVRLTGGLWDTSQAAFHNKFAIKIDPSKSTFKTRVDTTVFGNRLALSQLGNGTTAVGYDFIESGWLAATSSFDRIDITAHYCKHAFYMSEKDGGQWIPWVEVKSNAIYCKQPLFFGAQGNLKAQAYVQCGSVNNVDEQDLYQVYISYMGGDIELDIEFSDLNPGSYDPTLDGWGPAGGLENHGRKTILIGKSFDEIALGRITEWEFPYYNNRGFFINCSNFTMNTKLKNNTDGSYISDIHNTLIGVHKRVNVVYKVYDGTGFDFDTQLNPASTYSLPELADATYTRMDGLFDKSTLLSPIISFTEIVDNPSDFIEIVIPESRAYKYFDLDFTTVRMNWDRVQLIKTVSGTPESYILNDLNSSIRPTGSFYSFHHTFPSTSSGGFILRLIGRTSTGTSATSTEFKELAAYARYSPFGVISIAGGQRIYGDLSLGASGETTISIRDMYNRIVALENP